MTSPGTFCLLGESGCFERHVGCLCEIPILASVGYKGIIEGYCFARLDRYTSLYAIFVANYPV